MGKRSEVMVASEARSQTSWRQEKQEARTGRLLARIVSGEGRYADLSCLLPYYLGPAVKTRRIGSSSQLTSYFYYSRDHHLGNNPSGGDIVSQPTIWPNYTGVTFSAQGPFGLRPSV
jgi:hypothetical protein